MYICMVWQKREINSKKCLYEGVILPTTLYVADAWGMKSAE